MSAAFFLPLLVFLFCGIDLLIIVTGDRNIEVHGSTRKIAVVVDVVIMAASAVVTSIPYI